MDLMAHGLGGLGGFFLIKQHLNVLMEAQQYAEAEKIYREDLKKYKENGWALIGLYQALLKQGKKTEAQLVKKHYDKAWQFADAPLLASVL